MQHGHVTSTCLERMLDNGENVSTVTTWSSSSSSFYWASVTNAPNVLQPYWLIVLPLDVPDLTLVSFYEVLAARGGDVYEPSYLSNVPTFATSHLQEILAAKGGTTWARNG